MESDCDVGTDCFHSCACSKAPPAASRTCSNSVSTAVHILQVPLYVTLQMMDKMTVTMRRTGKQQRYPLRSPRQTMMITMAGGGSHRSRMPKQPGWQTLLQVRLPCANVLHTLAVLETKSQAGRLCFRSGCLLQTV